MHAIFKIVTVNVGRRSPAHCHGDQGRLQMLKHVTCSTLKPGEKCNMFQKVNFSFQKNLRKKICLKLNFHLQAE